MYCFRFVDETEGKTFNLKVECWFTPKTEEEKDYKRYVNSFLKRIKQMTYDIKDLIGYDEYIVNLDMRPSGIKFGKSSYMCSEIMLFSEKAIDVETYLSMLNTLFKQDQYFSFYQNKKDVA